MTTRRIWLSLIVPVWGDDQAVIELIESLPPRAEVEWIIAAADTSEYLRDFVCLHSAHVQLISMDRPSRGGQQHAGAEIARGELLCFHHADSILTPDHVEKLLEIAKDDRIVGGAFHRKFADSGPVLAFWERIVRHFTSIAGPFFGDQSIFVRASVYRKMGGFRIIPLMEDVDFSRRLRRQGKVVIADPPLRSSPRRFSRLGTWKTSAINVVFVILFYCGVSPVTLHRWYYAHRKQKIRDAPSVSKLL